MRTTRQILEDFIKFYSYFNDDYYNINLDDPIEFCVVYNKLLKKVYNGKHGNYFFKRFIIGDMKETGSGGIRWNRLLQKWEDIRYKNKHKYLLILCARSHGKTTKWSIMDTIYEGFRTGNYQQLIVSAGSGQSNLIIRDIRTIVENNEILSRLADFKHWSTEFLAFNGGFIISRGIGAEIRGLHPNRVVLDDILRSDEKMSASKIKAFVMEDIIPAIRPKNGDLVIVGTKKDATDIFSEIEELIKEGAKRWKFFRFPGILDMEKKIVLAEDIHTFKDLMEMKKTMGTLEFNKEILCEAMAEGSRIFPENLLQLAKDRSLSYEYKAEKGALYYAGADLARSGSVSADSTACLFIKNDQRFQRFVVAELYHKKGIKIKNQVKDVAVLCDKFNQAILLVEENNFGKDFIDWMIDDYSTTIESIRTTDVTKGDNIRRLLVVLENEKLKFPYCTKADKEKTELIFNELRRYVIKKTPAGNEKMEASGHSHDDIVDALSFAFKSAQVGGMVPGELPGIKGSELEHMMDLTMIPKMEGDLDSFDTPNILIR